MAILSRQLLAVASASGALGCPLSDRTEQIVLRNP